MFRRADTGKYCIAWWPAGSGQRRISRHPTGTRDLDEAKRKLIEFVERGGTASLPASLSLTQSPTRAFDPPILDVLCDYIERLTDRPAYRTSAPALRTWMEFFRLYNVRYVSDLTLDLQDEFVRWRRASITRKLGRCSNATINRELSVVKAAFGQAKRRRLLAVLPDTVSLPNPPARDRYLTVEEVQRLLAACTQPHLRLFVLLALHTLQSPIALLGLHVSQIDLKANRINFLPVGSVQSNKRRPIVPITPTLRPELERAMRDSISGYVIEWEGRRVKNIKTAFRKACKRAGLVNCSPYVLRHTGPTLLAAAGVPLREIAGFLGHSDTRTTELYAKHRPDFLSQAASKIDELFAIGASQESAPTGPPTASRDADLADPTLALAHLQTVAESRTGNDEQHAALCGTAAGSGLERREVRMRVHEGHLRKMERAKGFEPSTLTLAIGNFHTRARPQHRTPSSYLPRRIKRA
ncbi:MAG TPA: site-specific integrase [Phycisphaerales bacterium]|nr:site-specific integrase [Phycisphaerales bacterium]